MLFYAYIAYISKVITAYILPFKHNSLHLSTLMLRQRDYDVTIIIALLLRISLDLFYTPLYFDHQILKLRDIIWLLLYLASSMPHFLGKAQQLELDLYGNNILKNIVHNIEMTSN